MNGLMMDSQLTLSSIMRYADQVFPDTEIVSVTHDNPRHRYTYKDAFRRVRKLANALKDRGAQAGDRIATLAWNDYRHFELYYAVSCSGLVCHTINPRLFSEQLLYIINEAQDTMLFIDSMFVPIIEGIISDIDVEPLIVVLTDADNMPSSTKLSLLCYEDFIAECEDSFEFPELEESAASSLCYTSGTTGNPKGVLYSHRATILHTMASVSPNVFDLSASQCVLSIVPMFHVNAWGLPYSVAIAGAKLVLPGNKMADGPTLVDLINTEGVTFSAGVPTVWLALHQYLEAENKKVPSLKTCIVGGSACSQMLFEVYRNNYGVELRHVWGMTEMSPIGTVNIPKPGCKFSDLLQGLPIYGVEICIENEEGEPQPWDGIATGNLKVRGPCVLQKYFKATESALDANGWLDTGDIASISTDGYVQLTDRAKDLIKSGGEWISSIELENIAVGHPDIAEAAVIAAGHEKWDERPLLLAVRDVADDDHEPVSNQGLLDFYQDKVAKWWVPDEVVFVDELPHTATGKLDKKIIRKQYQNYYLSGGQ